MALRVEEYKVNLSEDAQALGRTPWIPSGWLDASDQIKAAPGLLGGILVRAADNDGNGIIQVWDTATGATTAAEVEMARVYCSATDELMIWVPFPLPGIEAIYGIYVEVTEDVEYEIYYR